MILQQRRINERIASTRAAFTLLEVLVVVAILVVLAGVGSVVLFSYLDQSKEKAAKLGISSIEMAISAYKINDPQGEYPADLTVLTQPLEGKPAPLDAAALLDPWQRPYIYERDNRHPLTGKPLIYSLGMNPANQNGQIRNWN
jgi:general secretion pathway protein G